MEDINQTTIIPCVVITLVLCYLIYRYLLNRTIMIENFNDHTVEY